MIGRAKRQSGSEATKHPVFPEQGNAVHYGRQKAHNYSTYYGCGIETMTEAHYQMTLPDDEYIFGNNSK